MSGATKIGVIIEGPDGIVTEWSSEHAYATFEVKYHWLQGGGWSDGVARGHDPDRLTGFTVKLRPGCRLAPDGNFFEMRRHHASDATERIIIGLNATISGLEAENRSLRDALAEVGGTTTTPGKE